MSHYTATSARLLWWAHEVDICCIPGHLLYSVCSLHYFSEWCFDLFRPLFIQYQLERLKTMCEEALVESLTVENACDILGLADTHNAEQLKAHTLEFIMLWVVRYGCSIFYWIVDSNARIVTVIDRDNRTTMEAHNVYSCSWCVAMWMVMHKTEGHFSYEIKRNPRNMNNSLKFWPVQWCGKNQCW